MKKEKFSSAISDKKDISKMCFVCGEDDQRILKKFERHHIFGRGNSDEIILLCPNCHGKITSRQNSISPKKREHKLAFQLIGQGELLITLGKEQIKTGNKILENGKDIS